MLNDLRRMGRIIYIFAGTSPLTAVLILQDLQVRDAAASESSELRVASFESALDSTGEDKFSKNVFRYDKAAVSAVLADRTTGTNYSCPVTQVVKLYGVRRAIVYLGGLARLAHRGLLRAGDMQLSSCASIRLSFIILNEGGYPESAKALKTAALTLAPFCFTASEYGRWNRPLFDVYSQLFPSILSLVHASLAQLRVSPRDKAAGAPIAPLILPKSRVVSASDYTRMQLAAQKYLEALPEVDEYAGVDGDHLADATLGANGLSDELDDVDFYTDRSDDSVLSDNVQYGDDCDLANDAGVDDAANASDDDDNDEEEDGGMLM